MFYLYYKIDMIFLKTINEEINKHNEPQYSTKGTPIINKKRSIYNTRIIIQQNVYIYTIINITLHETINIKIN